MLILLAIAKLLQFIIQYILLGLTAPSRSRHGYKLSHPIGNDHLHSPKPKVPESN